MTLLDIVVITLPLLSALMGLVRGLTREVLGLVSWIGGASLTLVCMPFVQVIARRYIQSAMMADIAAAIGLFLIFLILFSMISHVLSGVIKQSMLGGIDRSLGFLFGIGRGVVILCILETLISCFVPRQKHPVDMQTNRFAPLIYKGSDIIVNLLPKQAYQFINEQQQKHNTDVPQSLEGVAPNAQMMMQGVQQGIQKGVQQGIQQGVQQGVQQYLENQTQNQQPAQPGQQPRPQSPPPAQGLVPNQTPGATTQQEAEALARLQPKIIAPAPSTTNKQEQDLNRLLNMQDVNDAA